MATACRIDEAEDAPPKNSIVPLCVSNEILGLKKTYEYIKYYTSILIQEL